MRPAVPTDMQAKETALGYDSQAAGSSLARDPQAKEKSLAYGLLRIAFGVNLAGHGIIPLYSLGLAQFAAGNAGRLSKSPLPHGLILGFLYCVPIVEAIVGIALILGLGTRIALIISTLLLIAFMVGVTSNQQWETAGSLLVYNLVLFALLFLIEHNGLSLDRLLRRRSQ